MDEGLHLLLEFMQHMYLYNQQYSYQTCIDTSWELLGQTVSIIFFYVLKLRYFFNTCTFLTLFPYFISLNYILVPLIIKAIYYSRTTLVILIKKRNNNLIQIMYFKIVVLDVTLLYFVNVYTYPCIQHFTNLTCHVCVSSLLYRFLCLCFIA